MSFARNSANRSARKAAASSDAIPLALLLKSSKTSKLDNACARMRGAERVRSQASKAERESCRVMRREYAFVAAERQQRVCSLTTSGGNLLIRLLSAHRPQAFQGGHRRPDAPGQCLLHREDRSAAVYGREHQRKRLLISGLLCDSKHTRIAEADAEAYPGRRYLPPHCRGGGINGAGIRLDENYCAGSTVATESCQDSSRDRNAFDNRARHYQLDGFQVRHRISSPCVVVSVRWFGPRNVQCVQRVSMTLKSDW